MLVRFHATVRYSQRWCSPRDGQEMNVNDEQDDLRERAARLFASPWTPVFAALVFILAIFAALLSVLTSGRSDGDQEALTNVIRAARAGNHVQAAQLAFDLRLEPGDIFPHFSRLLTQAERTPHDYLGEANCGVSSRVPRAAGG